MSLNISIEKLANHVLILSMVLRCFSLEEVHALLAQDQSDLFVFISENKFIRGGQEVWDDFDLANRLICVLYFVFINSLAFAPIARAEFTDNYVILPIRITPRPKLGLP